MICAMLKKVHNFDEVLDLAFKFAVYHKIWQWEIYISDPQI